MHLHIGIVALYINIKYCLWLSKPEFEIYGSYSQNMHVCFFIFSYLFYVVMDTKIFPPKS